MYGRIFAEYLKDPENLFVISSDFCHWGRRFRYTYYDKSKGNIYESIEDLDKLVITYFCIFCFRVSCSRFKGNVLFEEECFWMITTKSYPLFVYFLYFIFLSQGMKHIESLDCSAFYGYLERYSNTICGRHPIGIFLNVSSFSSLV